MKKKRLIPFKYLPGSWGLTKQVYDEAEASYYYDGEELDNLLNDIRYKYSRDETAYKKAKASTLLKYNHINDYEYEVRIKTADGTVLSDKAILELKHAHKMISDYDFEIGVIDLIESEDEDDEIKKKVARLGVELRYGNMNEYDHDVEVAEVMTEDDSDARSLALLDVELKHEKITQTQYDKEKATILGEPWIGIIDSGFDPKNGLNGVYFEFDWNNRWIDFLRDNGYSANTDEKIVELWFADVCQERRKM